MPVSAPFSTFTVNDTVKCQSCIICRARKLRCIRESTGCKRCVAQGLDCVYPPRRVMGRPRSHAANESSKRGTPTSPKPLALQVGPALHVMRLASSPPRAMPPIPKASKPNSPQAPASGLIEQQFQWIEFGIGILDYLRSISFGSQDPLQHGLLPEGARKARSPNKPEAKHVTLSSAVPCHCIERLLGAAELLSMITNDFWSALWTARHSSRTIYEVLKCPQCRTISKLTAAKMPQHDGPMDVIHDNVSLIIIILATVVFPLMSDVYYKVAELVKEEANAAMDAGIQLVFDLKACGGLWGPLGESNTKCQEHYCGLPMDPVSWRTTVRALLRADVHGFDIQKRVDEDGPDHYHQPGLCDFISDIKDVLKGSGLDREQQDSLRGPQIEWGYDMGLICQMIEAAEQSLSQLALT